MSHPPDNDPPPAPAGPGAVPPLPTAVTSILDLIASRVAIILLESKETAGQWTRRLLLFVIAGLCALFAWALLVAGLVTWISEAAGWPWHWVALGAAVCHGIAAWISTLFAKPSASETFPITRSEFKKDRQWIESFQKPRKPSA
jgi:uncharacterized membrane protein YqjE